MVINFCRTVIGLGEGERKFGEAANIVARSNYKDTVWGFNRFLGMKQSSVYLKEELKYVFAKCVPADNKGIAFELTQRGHTKAFTPEQLCGAFISKLKRICESVGLVANNMVIAVPPYFSSVERQALLDATKLAKINCVRLLNETTAIGLCYGVFKNDQFTNTSRNVIFIDLGYSNLTVSIMNFRSSGFRILAQGCKGNLGARNMDYAVMNKLAEESKKKWRVDFRDSAKAVIRVSEAIEKARKILSANNDTQIIVESISDDKDICYNITRKEFEGMINPFIEDMIIVCQQVLEESKLEREKINAVELVGEASRIPIIIQRVQEWIGMTTSRTMNSADCIARGCALQCAMLNPQFKLKEYTATDFNPFPIDVAYNIPKSVPSKKVMTLFKRGDHFPIVKSLTFENRVEPLMLHLKYNDPSSLPLAGPESLGSYRTNPGAIKGKFILGVKIVLDSNMIGAVKVAEVITDGSKEGKVIDLEFQVHGLANSKISEYLEEEKRAQHEDQMIISTKEERNFLESYVYEMKAKIPGELDVYIDKNSKQKFMLSLEKTEKWLMNEKKKHDKETYTKILNELNKVGDPVVKRYKKYANLAEHEIILGNKIHKLHEVDKELLEYKDRGRIMKLVNEQAEWMKRAGEALASCSRLNDPIIKDSDYINRIKLLDGVLNPITL